MLVSGTAVITGVKGDISYDTPNPVLAYTSLTQSISSTHEAEKAFVKDADGNDTTVVCCNEGYKITIHIVPADNSGTNSVTKAIAQCRAPQLCSGVTLSGFPLPHLNNSFWVYLGGASFDLDNNSNPVRMNLPIEYRVANDLSKVVNA